MTAIFAGNASATEPYASARIGYSAPLGSVSRNAPLSTVATGAIPFSLSLGGTLSSRVALVGHVELAYLHRDCGALAGCGGIDVHPGFALHAKFLEREPVTLWFELGAGAEILSASSSGGGVSASAVLLGVEPLRLTIGADYRIGKSWTVGLWTSFASGIFAASFTNLQGLESDTAIHERSMHHWLSVGLSFGFGR